MLRNQINSIQPTDNISNDLNDAMSNAFKKITSHDDDYNFNSI